MKKVLIVHTSVGLGHKFMAYNIAEHLRAVGYDVKLADILQVQSGKLVDVSRKIHHFINNSTPWLWRWLYINKIFTEITLPMRYWVAAGQSGHLKELVDEYQPEMIISTAAVAPAVVGYLKRKKLYNGLFGVAFSDYHLHRYWLVEEADFYFANIAEQKEEMVRLGVPADRIFVLGITIPPNFMVDQKQSRIKLGIDSDAKVMLVSGGSMGYGINKKFILDLLDKLDSLPQLQDARLIVVCGNDKEHYEELSQLTDKRLKVVGFYTPMTELYAASDLFVGKPGGLTTAECLLYRLPIFITHWLPGQEELNIKYLLKNNLIKPIFGIDPKKIPGLLAEELETGKVHKALEADLKIYQLLNVDPKLLEQTMQKVFALKG